jgi:hypothetical protein
VQDISQFSHKIDSRFEHLDEKWKDSLISQNAILQELITSKEKIPHIFQEINNIKQNSEIGLKQLLQYIRNDTQKEEIVEKLEKHKLIFDSMMENPTENKMLVEQEGNVVNQSLRNIGDKMMEKFNEQCNHIDFLQEEMKHMEERISEKVRKMLTVLEENVKTVIWTKGNDLAAGIQESENRNELRAEEIKEGIKDLSKIIEMSIKNENALNDNFNESRNIIVEKINESVTTLKILQIIHSSI